MSENTVEVLNARVANDNGNNEQKIKVNGVLRKFPNTFKKIDEAPPAGDVEALDLVPTLLEKMVVNISSPSISNQGFYLIGHRAVGTAKARSMNIDKGEKYLEDIPLVNTLAHFAGIAVQNAVKDTNTLPKNIYITADMTTALPASEWTPETAEIFGKRFENHVHVVTVYIGHETVVVTIRFEFVKVMQEGTPTLFSLIEDKDGNYRSDDIFDEFKKEYELEKWDGRNMKELTIFHSDIGDGTVEYITTRGYTYDPDFSDGEQRGIGHAIERAAKKLGKARHIKITRQEFVGYLKDKHHRYHEDAVKELEPLKKEQAELILEDIEDRLRNMKYEVDVVVVYGGGSIQLRDDLYAKLKGLCDYHRIKLFWVPAKYATTMNVEGMDIYNQVMLPKAKEKALAAK